jgi:hypothetical protein
LKSLILLKNDNTEHFISIATQNKNLDKACNKNQVLTHFSMPEVEKIIYYAYYKSMFCQARNKNQVLTCLSMPNKWADANNLLHQATLLQV